MKETADEVNETNKEIKQKKTGLSMQRDDFNLSPNFEKKQKKIGFWKRVVILLTGGMFERAENKVGEIRQKIEETKMQKNAPIIEKAEKVQATMEVNKEHIPNTLKIIRELNQVTANVLIKQYKGPARVEIQRKETLETEINGRILEAINKIKLANRHYEKYNYVYGADLNHAKEILRYIPQITKCLETIGNEKISKNSKTALFEYMRVLKELKTRMANLKE